VNKRLLSAVLGAGALAVTALTAGVQTADAAAPHLTHLTGLHAKRVCSATPAAGHATCLSKVLVNKKGAIPMAATPLASALSPDQLKAAYGLTGTSSGGRTVAIVDAYGYPNLERDLTAYRSFYKMSACTTANGCLKIVNQTGGTTLPSADLGWSQEQALDVDAVSAACPDCKILVVQASSASFADLGAAVNTAARQAGVVAISNSYGGSDAPDSTYGTYYSHPGIAVTASTGDNGYKGGSYPASSAYVTAVGGTTLKMSGTTRSSETVWSGAGSGCSAYNTAVAPQYGGTSESSPIIASVYALAGGNYANTSVYALGNASNLHDIVSGSNSRRKCPATQWCVARVGWDGPTGLGTPNGTGAF
jgi:subtilase family serine protease